MPVRIVTSADNVGPGIDSTAGKSNVEATHTVVSNNVYKTNLIIPQRDTSTNSQRLEIELR